MAMPAQEDLVRRAKPVPLECDDAAVEAYLERLDSARVLSGDFSDLKRMYLAALAKTGKRTVAARSAGVIYRTVQHWRATDAPFLLAEQEAVETWFEDVAMPSMEERAFVGTLRPLVGRVGRDQDDVVAHERVWSDRLAEYLARVSGIERLRDKQRVELTGAGGGPVEIAPVLSRFRERLDDQARRLAGGEEGK